MLGRALGDAKLEADGADRIDRWIAYTAENGVSEYNSPCYSAVDVYALEWIYHYASDEALRRKVARCLDYLYADIFQQWHWEAGIGAGTHSRAYERDRDSGRSLVSCLVFKQCGQPLRPKLRSFLHVFIHNQRAIPNRVTRPVARDRCCLGRFAMRTFLAPLVHRAWLVASCALCSYSFAAEKPSKPNILLIVPDQMRGDCLSILGHTATGWIGRRYPPRATGPATGFCWRGRLCRPPRPDTSG